MPLKIKILERVSLAKPELCIDHFTRIVQITSVESSTQMIHNLEDIILEAAGVDMGGPIQMCTTYTYRCVFI